MIINEFSKKIYKKDSKGKIRILHVYTEGNDVIQNSGVYDSQNMVTHVHTCEGKNIGRSNETTPEEQANLEAASKIDTKMTTGYFNTIQEAEDEVVILPMLAKDYKKEYKKVTFPCYGQPKLDGMRALYNKKTGFISRKGKLIETMNHIDESVPNVSMIFNNEFIDGELYAHGYTFQENMKATKKIRATSIDGAPATSEIQYHVYDMVLPGPFIKRYNMLVQLVTDIDNIHIVPTAVIHNDEQLKEYHQKNIADGYEGTIIRHGDSGYGINKRDSQLLKYKDFIDEAYEVVDIVPSDKNPEQGVVHCSIGGGYDNVTFGCGMKFSHKERENMLINKTDYIGKTAEIRFFEYTDDGLPRFPVCVGFRLDK